MPGPTLLALGARLVSVASDPVRLAHAYSDHLQMILAAPLWSTEHPEGARIPWRLAKEAREHQLMRPAFDSPGLYLFGSQEGVPLYLGKTRKTLWGRLARRYVNGERSQCQLAATYEKQLIADGMRGFPSEIRAWYSKQYRNSTVRLVGAVAFVQHGINGIWFTLIPVKDPSQADSLERLLIPVVDEWNTSHSYPPLLNLHYNSIWRARAKVLRSDAQAYRLAKRTPPRR
jgi:hypothetical protein